MIGKLLEELGAEPVGMPAPRIYESMQRGTIDGYMLPWEAVKGFRLEEVSDQHTEFGFYSLAFVLTMNKARYESLPAEMARGSVLIWHGSLWHGGGANRTRERRVGIAMNYCAGFIRSQENQQLGIPREIAARFSPRLRELVGYGIYRGLIGHIDKHSPAQLLDGESDLRMVWDR